jgi:hypothetical protein
MFELSLRALRRLSQFMSQNFMVRVERSVEREGTKLDENLNQFLCCSAEILSFSRRREAKSFANEKKFPTRDEELNEMCL